MKSLPHAHTTMQLLPFVRQQEDLWNIWERIESLVLPHMHTAMHHSCCHLPADPCKGGVFPHLREGALTAQVLHQYTVEGRETSSHLEVNVCRKKYLQVNQHTARVVEQFDKHLYI